MSTEKAKFELFSRLQALGFTYEEAQALRRIQMTLHRWSEEECNGTIERNDAGQPTRSFIDRNGDRCGCYLIADREAGALKRLAAIMANHPDFVAYHQGDPRGCALYLVKQSDLGGRTIDRVYNRGLAVCA